MIGFRRRRVMQRMIWDAHTVAMAHTLDENLGETTERFQTIMAILSEGTDGHDWGHERNPFADSMPWTLWRRKGRAV